MTRFQLFKYLSVLLIGALISFFIFYNINARYLSKNKITVDNTISKSILKITDELNKINLVIESMGFFFENHDDVSQNLFEQFTNPYLKQLPSIGALEWAPKIGDSKNKEIEELVITESDSAGGFVPITANEVHYPIALLNPLKPLKDAIGYDNYSEENRKSAIDLAISTKEITFTAPIELVQKNNGVLGFLALKAVQDSNLSRTKGIVAGIYRMDLFVKKTLKNELPIVNITITDSAANENPLFTNLPLKKHKEGSEIIKKLNIGNRTWYMSFIPKQKYIDFPHVLESYLVLLFGLLTTGLLVYVVKKNDDYNDRLEARVLLRTSELEASNKMKENLLREIHHRVKNNLQITSSLMNMQKRKLVSKEAITALSDSQARISAIALTHQKIYQDQDSKAVNLHDYLVDLMEHQKKISASFTYKINCPYISIDLDRAVPLALIISELVTNAVKHAYPDTTKYNELLIDVTEQSGENVLLSIRDNGKGLPEHFNIKEAEGIGFEIIRALCRQISAKLTYESNDYGTQFDLAFRNQAQA
ncbi:CHASE domain-containing protein [Pseudozobellia sp. WGM2]|uniref:CHASE domain-containing protein n=1 Tax=Pseudozobellia sp. WGM2 TaxID=2787625 RepID=UPI001AE03506|nr:CHASE domain-containing protein [Pseudozobellia sp. WGM2]